jgi:hypothetical protein
MRSPGAPWTAANERRGGALRARACIALAFPGHDARGIGICGLDAPPRNREEIKGVWGEKTFPPKTNHEAERSDIRLFWWLASRCVAIRRSPAGLCRPQVPPKGLEMMRWPDVIVLEDPRAMVASSPWPSPS